MNVNAGDSTFDLASNKDNAGNLTFDLASNKDNDRGGA